jgi:hypothetical protein
MTMAAGAALVPSDGQPGRACGIPTTQIATAMRSRMTEDERFGADNLAELFDAGWWPEVAARLLVPYPEATHPNLVFALWYASRGLPVFPCQAGAPNPKAPLTPRADPEAPEGTPKRGGGYHYATTDQAQIIEWWTRWPGALIGGAMEAAGLVAIDHDPPKSIATDAALVAEHGAWPETVTSHSGKGLPGAAHRVYTYDGDGGLPGTLGAGIDVKHRGYIILPPSKHPETRQPYTWEHGIDEMPFAPLPAWIIERKARPAPSAIHEYDGTVPIGEQDNYLAARALSYACKSLSREANIGALLGEAGTWDQTPGDPWLRKHVEPKVDSAMRKVAAEPNGEKAGAAKPAASRKLTRRRFEGEPERIFWHWRDYLPRAKFSIQDGDPGKGKSTIFIDLAARLTAGANMPDGTPGLEGGGFVLVLMGEDGHQDTTYPRLIAAGADLSRIEALKPSEVLIPRDVPLLEEAIRDTRAVAVFLDPINTYLGDERVNTHNDKQVRQALDPLVEMGERTSCAMVGNRHLNKGNGGPAIYRGMGSIGIGGLARSVWCVADDPGNDGGFILASIKHNLNRTPPSLHYTIEEVELPSGGISRINWGGASDLTADDLLGEDPAEAGVLVTAIRSLEALLEPLGADGMALDDVKGWAKSEGTAWRTLERAKTALGVRSVKQGFTCWTWVLPPKGARVSS